MSVADAAVDLDAIRSARARTSGHVRHTPLLRKDSLSDTFGCPVYLKGEHLQRTGSFKIRGALSLISQLSSEQRQSGVVAASAGNHAQGVAVAAAEQGVKATIFMPADATLSKVEATQSYGAEVVLTGDHFDAALVAAREFEAKTGATFVHPFDDPRIMAGQGTLGLELLEDLPDMDTLIVPIGGGGLFAGVAAAVKEQRPSCRMVGVQAAACASLGPSLSAGTPVEVPLSATMADGIAVKQTGELTLSIVQRYLDELVTVDEEAISSSMLWLIERAKQVVEGAAVTPLAALQSGAVQASGNTVCLLSGGNIDSMLLMSVIRHGLSAVGRFITVSTVLPDRPGELSKLLSLLANENVNVLAVEHRREGLQMRLGLTRVEITLQTRNRKHVTEVLEQLRMHGYETQLRI